MKKSVISIASMCFVLSLLFSCNIQPAMGTSPAEVLPELPSFREGTNVNVTKDLTNMNIQILGGDKSVGTAYWNSFNIGSGANFNVEFTANNQTSLNYVDAAGGMSKIYGNFTDSGYNATGKVLLINPNGILFGNGANINLNSFTASTLNGTYNAKNNTLVLSKTGKESAGIIVDNGAIIKGDKNVSLISDKIDTYKGSQIRTGYKWSDEHSMLNYENRSNSIKLVTTDGITFKYSNDGNLSSDSKLVSSSKKMVLNLRGDIDATNIDIKNSSTNKNSQINIDGAKIKAHKFIQSDDGSISIVANNDINIDNSDIEMSNHNSVCYADGLCMDVSFNMMSDIEWNVQETPSNYPVNPIEIIQSREYDSKTTENQSINISAKNNLNINSSKLSSLYNSNDLKINSTAGNVNIKSSSIDASNVNIQAKKNLMLSSSNISASDLKLKSLSNGVSINDSSIWAQSNNIDVNSNSDLLVSNSSLKSRNKINMVSKDNTNVDNNYFYTNNLVVNTTKTLNFNKNKVATKDTELKSTNGSTRISNNDIYTKNDLDINSSQELYFNNNNILSKNITLNSKNNKANANNNNVYTFGNFDLTTKQNLTFDNNNLNAKNAEIKSTNNTAYIINNKFTTRGDLNINSKKDLSFVDNDVSSENNVVLKSTNGKVNVINNNFDIKNNFSVTSKTKTTIYNNKVNVGNKVKYTAKNKKVVEYGNS